MAPITLVRTDDHYRNELQKTLVGDTWDEDADLGVHRLTHTVDGVYTVSCSHFKMFARDNVKSVFVSLAPYLT